MIGSLRIAQNLKSVIYDGRSYDVAQVVRVSRELETDIMMHQCNGPFIDSIELAFTVVMKRKLHYAGFCNRCKKLFLKEVKK